MSWLYAVWSYQWSGKVSVQLMKNVWLSGSRGWLDQKCTINTIRLKCLMLCGLVRKIGSKGNEVHHKETLWISLQSLCSGLSWRWRKIFAQAKKKWSISTQECSKVFNSFCTDCQERERKKISAKRVAYLVCAKLRSFSEMSNRFDKFSISA